MRRTCNFKYLSLLLVLCALSFGAIPAQAQISKNAVKKDLIKRILKRNALSRLPYTSKIVVSSNSARRSSFAISTVSGTPPTLASIPDSDISTLFWREGVIDAIGSGSPDQMQCSEFHAGQADDLSGGMGACRMAEGMGYTFADLIQSQLSICYMKNFPTKKNLKARAVEVVRGKLPNGDITKLFNTPGGQARLVKVNVQGDGDGGGGDEGGPPDEEGPPQDGGPPPGEGGGPGGQAQEGPGNQAIFLRVSSSKENKINKNLYEVSIWHCKDGDSSPSEVNYFKISSTGLYTSENFGKPLEQESAAFRSTVSGLLKASSSSLSWDSSKSRTIDKSFRDGENAFKAQIEIGSLIRSKTFDSFQGRSNKNYSVSSFTGTDVTDVRFLAGAYKGIFDDQFSFIGATEFRDSSYRAAPNNELVSQVSSFDFDADDFFSSSGNAELDFSQYDCTAAPDIELNLDMSNSALQTLKSKCEMVDFRNMHFCHEDSAVQAAEQNFGPVCHAP